MFNYSPSGVCSKEIHFDINDNKIYNLNFVGGCPGNLMGLSKLIEGMEITEAIEKLKGIKCGNKDTSCPDQLSKALQEAIKKCSWYNHEHFLLIFFSNYLSHISNHVKRTRN